MYIGVFKHHSGVLIAFYYYLLFMIFPNKPLSCTMRTCGPCLSTNIAVAASTSLTVDISSSLRSSLVVSIISPRLTGLVFTVVFLLYPLVYGVFCNAWIRHGRYDGSTIHNDPLPKFCMHGKTYFLLIPRYNTRRIYGTMLL